MNEKIQKIVVQEKKMDEYILELDQQENKIISEYRHRAHLEIHKLQQAFEKEAEILREKTLEDARIEMLVNDEVLHSSQAALKRDYDKNREEAVLRIIKEVTHNGNR